MPLHEPSAPDRYCRLFPPVESPFDATAMTALGLSMDKLIPATSNPRILAGYTYFGQFIDHDLTRDDTPLWEAGKLPPGKTKNHRTAWLDLDNLYGDGPCSAQHRHLYAEDGVSFRLGTPIVNGEQFDVPLDETTRAPQLADDRNNENVIVRQVHAIFLKLHNAAVKELPAKLPPEERFKRARDRVRWQYQWLVRHDFLRTICHPEVYRDVIENGCRLLDWQGLFSIPVEFSQAAFRFGHSLVRDSYVLNLEPGGKPGDPPTVAGVPLQELFRSAHEPGELSRRMRVDWNRFLGGPTGRTKHEFALFIDTSIAKPLFDLPRPNIRLFVESLAKDEPKELPVRTLLRGAATGLPTGEYVAEKFGRNPLTIPNGLGLNGKTPLWYYVLLEAELEVKGASLGRVGSRLVAEVIEECLRADPGSFLRQNESEWVPPPWTGRDGRPIAVKTFLDLAAVVGLATSRNS